jgi:PiT family inorganic phosphate transporter
MSALLLGLLIAAAFAFAISIGAHYTGACMGMPYAAGAIRAPRALLLMAPLAFVGALVASEAVERTVGHGLLSGPAVSFGLALAIVGTALALTSAYNFATVPTSTIQILVFSTVGAGLAAGETVQWRTIDGLLVLWAVAPVAACGLGYLFVRLADRERPVPPKGAPLARAAATTLVAVGAVASFAMGANDVSNATGALVQSGVFDLVAAAAVGGAGLAIGVLTWGRPLLEKVAFRVVPLDARMAIASQFAQSTVVLVSVAFGAFTSMNQALVGAMIGTGLARGRGTVPWAPIRDILIGWAIGPVSGAAVGFAVATAFVHLGIA